MALSEHISIDSIVIDTENMTVEITDPLVRIDVGAIAKGYTAELIKKELVSMGKSGLVLDMGGNLCAIGAKPNGDGWKSGIRNPLHQSEGAEPYIRTVNLKNASLVTSGVYERYYVVGGVRYHHILDPETLMPENRYLSVTVHTEHSGIADALSTAIFNMDYEDAVNFIKDFGKAEVTFVFNDGSYSVVDGTEK
jgi:thiamine biosynthesis lipoprotein